MRRLGPEPPDLSATREALRRWVAETRVFPEPRPGAMHQSFDAPVSMQYDGDDAALDAVRNAIAQAHLDVAANLIAARPPRYAHMKVAAVLCAPNLEWSQVCVFFDTDYAANFEVRTEGNQIWTPLERRSFARDNALAVPDGLRERGYHERQENDDLTFEQDIWIYGD